MAKKIIIIGGGIMGLSSAFYLQQQGYEVTVIDKDDLSDNCSYGNAGYVCPSHFIPLATPGIIKQGIKWMLNSQSPFYVQPRLSLPLIDWGLKFMRNATAKHVHNAAQPLLDIAIISKKLYEDWLALPEFDFAYEQKGLLELFQTNANAHHAEETVQRAVELGLTDTKLLSRDEVLAMEPGLQINTIGGIYFKCDAHLYPPKLMQQMLQYLQAKGVAFKTNQALISFKKEKQRIVSVTTTKGTYEADEIVIAAGSWSREVSALTGIKIPLVGGRGYSVTLENSPYKLNHPAVLQEARTAITPMDGNKIRFGGTMEITDTNTPPRYNRVQGILNGVKSFYPDWDIAMPPKEKIWYGFRPVSADGLPYIGRSKYMDNVVMATGHAMVGLSLGAATGKLVSEVINNDKLSMDIQPFHPDRFR